MTSLTRMEKGKPSGVGRCLLATDDLPLRRRRIQILFPRVAAISSPKAGDVGPAAPHDTGRMATLIETPVVASLVAALLPAGQPGGGVLGRRHPFISLGRERGGDTAQDFTYRHPRLGFDWLRHGHNHEGSHAREVVNCCQDSGNVCRA